jgi:holo-[acyl-carrier protein] synthase
VAILGHGIDVVEVSRIARLLGEHGERFLERCFTPGERCVAVGARGDERLAARFAAKEAALKALGSGLIAGISWHDVSVEVEASGAPRLVVTGEAGRIARERGVRAWHVSLSHAGGVATASVIAEG